MTVPEVRSVASHKIGLRLQTPPSAGMHSARHTPREQAREKYLRPVGHESQPRRKRVGRSSGERRGLFLDVANGHSRQPPGKRSLLRKGRDGHGYGFSLASRSPVSLTAHRELEPVKS